MPKRPITATRKWNPDSSAFVPKVSRSCPVTMSMPTAAIAKPSIIDATILNGLPLPVPTKLQNVRR